jgi:hypothetical protein
MAAGGIKHKGPNLKAEPGNKASERSRAGRQGTSVQHQRLPEQGELQAPIVVPRSHRGDVVHVAWEGQEKKRKKEGRNSDSGSSSQAPQTPGTLYCYGPRTSVEQGHGKPLAVGSVMGRQPEESQDPTGTDREAPPSPCLTSSSFHTCTPARATTIRLRLRLTDDAAVTRNSDVVKKPQHDGSVSQHSPKQTLVRGGVRHGVQ